MAGIFLLCGIVTRIVGEAIFGYETGVYGLILRYQAEGESIVICLIFIPILIMAAGILSLFIYHRDDDHFGIWGTIRWSLAGVIYGLLKVVIDLLVGVVGFRGIGELVEDLLGFLAIVLSYFAVFMILPQAKRILGESK